MKLSSTEVLALIRAQLGAFVDADRLIELANEYKVAIERERNEKKRAA